MYRRRIGLSVVDHLIGRDSKGFQLFTIALRWLRTGEAAWFIRIRFVHQGQGIAAARKRVRGDSFW